MSIPVTGTLVPAGSFAVVAVANVSDAASLTYANNAASSAVSAIPDATASVKGLATTAQISKLDALPADAQSASQVASAASAAVAAIPDATTLVKGLATTTQITKLDGLPADAQSASQVSTAITNARLQVNSTPVTSLTFPSESVSIAGGVATSRVTGPVTNWPLKYAARILGWYSADDAPTGAIASLPDRRLGEAAATQGTSGNQPVGEAATLSRGRRISCTVGSAHHLVLPSALYSALSGASAFSSYTVLVRCRPRSWSDRNIFGVTAGGYHQHLCVANPAWKLLSSHGTVTSDSTDISQTTRYVAFVYNATAGTVSIIERGTEVSVVTTPSAATVTAATLFAVGAGLNPFDGSGDEAVVFSGALSAAEIKAALPYLFRDRRMNILTVGNSLGAGYVGATPYLSQLEDMLPADIGVTAAYCRGAAQTSALVTAMGTKFADQVIPGRSALFFWEATNSILNGATLAQLQADHIAAKAIATAQGCATFGATCLPRTAFSGAQNAVRDAWNAELLANPTAYVTSASHIVRLDQITQLADASNATYYTDGTHVTTLGGTYVAKKCVETFLGVL